MINIGVNDGHTISGPGTGAVGRIIESEHTRLVGGELRALLSQRGINAINCTVDYADSQAQALSLIVQQANRQDLDWIIFIHFNAGGGRGVEVYTYEGRQYPDAIEVCKNIEALGFINRGVKAGSGLYVIRKTKAKSMLIEVCFVDTEDADHYLSIGYKTVAKAIADALVEFVEEKPTEQPVAQPIQVEAPSTPQPIPETVQAPAAEKVQYSELQSELNAQLNAGLSEDNIPGPKTLAACPTIREGARGSITKWIQKKLKELGFNCGNADGVFGSMTLSAVMAFQKSRGLLADGVIGKNTWRKLLGL